MKNIVLVLVGFILYYIGFKYFEDIMLSVDKIITNGLASYCITYIIIGLPIFIATCIINKDFNFFAHLGLQSNILKGIIICLLFALPMFIGSYFQSNFIENINMNNLIAKTFLAGLFEELYFRGFFFGQLFKKTKLGFLPSIILCSIIFAMGHLYQSHDASTLFGIFITTFMGSVLFAWLYVEWNYNLWIPIFLHSFMNLSWYIFSISNNALGSVNSNVFRIITISLSIFFTLIYKKRMKEKLAVNRKTLLKGLVN